MCCAVLCCAVCWRAAHRPHPARCLQAVLDAGGQAAISYQGLLEVASDCVQQPSGSGASFPEPVCDALDTLSQYCYSNQVSSSTHAVRVFVLPP
jgi:hypothetical protein